MTTLGDSSKSLCRILLPQSKPREMAELTHVDACEMQQSVVDPRTCGLGLTGQKRRSNQNDCRGATFAPTAAKMKIDIELINTDGVIPLG
jgi:hypothetical protein